MRLWRAVLVHLLVNMALQGLECRVLRHVVWRRQLAGEPLEEVGVFLCATKTGPMGEAMAAEGSQNEGPWGRQWQQRGHRMRAHEEACSITGPMDRVTTPGVCTLGCSKCLARGHSCGNAQQ